MKTSEFKKLAWALFALMLTSSIVSAQRWGNRINRQSETNALPCLVRIDGLSDKQKAEIQTLAANHQEAMESLRTERRSTAGVDEKAGIREKMLEQKVDHRNAVKALLNPEQQRQYDLIQAGNGRGMSMGKGFQNGKGNYGNRNGWSRGNRGGRANCYASAGGRGPGRFGNGNGQGYGRCFRN